jgi:hypothetical protein
MTVSNGAPFPLVLRVDFNKQGAEPGYCADGEYGIRNESAVVVRDAQTPNNFGDKSFLGLSMSRW